MAGNIWLWQTSIERCDALGHSKLVFLPQRSRQWRIEGRFVILHTNWLVSQAIALFQKTGGFGVCWPSQPNDRQERCQKGEDKYENDAETQDVWHVPENAEPGEREKSSTKGKRPKASGRQALREHHQFGEKPFCCDPARKIGPVFEGAREALPAFVVLPGCGHQSVLPVLATSHAIPGMAKFLLPESKDNILYGEDEGKRTLAPIF